LALGLKSDQVFLWLLALGLKSDQVFLWLLALGLKSDQDSYNQFPQYNLHDDSDPKNRSNRHYNYCQWYSFDYNQPG
jgi:hypothetical protein